jgi:sugar transferase (PEP-CTERM/EpsH1 system associated)
MRVLHFAPRVCWPLDTGAKLRNYHLGRILSEHARVTLLAFKHEGEPDMIPENHYDQIVTVKRGHGYPFTKILRGALGTTPLPLLNYTTDSMKQALESLLSEHDFDLVQIESIHLLDYLPIIRAAGPRALVICDWHNIESELMRRYSEREGNILRRGYARRTTRLMAESEKRAMSEFDAHVTVSQRDAEQLRNLNPRAQIFVIENGVDAAFYSDEQIANAYSDWHEQTTLPNPRRIVFVGSMDYHANVDGALSFCREVWPRLRNLKPDLTFIIVGRDPSATVRDLASVPGVEVTGTVDDVRPYYRDAVASIVPLKVGGGSRLKILESMAAGVPVISTTLGAEGLDVRHDENILIADTSEETIEAIVRVIEDEPERKRLVEAGRALVFSQYDWSKLGMSLVNHYLQLLDDREAS